MEIESRNPATGKLISRFDQLSESEIGDALSNATKAFSFWQGVPIIDRSHLTAAVGSVLGSRITELSELMTREMGKPIREARSEVEKCAWLCDYYAQNAGHFLEDENVNTDAAESFITYQPLGVILGIMPWNFPLWQVFRFAIPSLLAGNVGLLKHASNVPACAQAIESVFVEAGYPSYVFRNLFIDKSQVADIVGNPAIAAVTLTGSTAAGKSVAGTAGGALKKTVLELGGSDPYIVLSDADLDHAAKTCVASRLINSGQSCIAAKRFIVVTEQATAFTSRVVHLMESTIMGDPMDEKSEIGPLARIDLRDEVHRQVLECTAAGATLLTGGFLPERTGSFYPPTVLANVKPGMPAYDKEIFGPVASIIEAEDECDAIRIANDTNFGLGAAIFTADIQRGRLLARDQLEAGACFVNSMVRSDPRLPFGGIKESGYGRELSRQGIREFTNTKTVYIGQT